ncbi:MAG: hypothetical protein IPH95_08330 [Candidatus Promineofilum sp.]|nr:hypothetical protein [Promineifilum sp.]
MPRLSQRRPAEPLRPAASSPTADPGHAARAALAAADAATGTAAPTATATPVVHGHARPRPPPHRHRHPTRPSACPAPDPWPVKPDYAAYTLTADPWPTPDATAVLPPLSLVNPLPTAGRNAGYPYGSDGSGRYLLHNGLDMADEDDALAVAAGDGTVVLARDDLDELFGWRCDWYGQVRGNAQPAAVAGAVVGQRGHCRAAGGA